MCIRDSLKLCRLINAHESIISLLFHKEFVARPALTFPPSALKRRYTVTMRSGHYIGCVLIALLTVQSTRGLAQVLDSKRHHLRSGQEMEWDEFADTPEGKELILKFTAAKNEAEQTLRLRQRDVKQAWNIRLNDKKLATLLQDEKDTVLFLKLPPQ